LEENKYLGRNLIFVGGSARSGTTLIQNMLDSHPVILGGPEFLHLPEIIKLRNSMQRNVEKGWIDQICSNENVDARFRTLILDFLVPFAEKHNAELLSEKTPENVLVFPELATLLPEAKFIFVVRDPRAIVASMFQVGKRAKAKGARLPDFTQNTDAAIKYIKTGLDRGFRANQQASDRFLIIRYEEVVLNPVAETQRMCKFLNIEWDEAMCSPSEKKHMGEQAITTKSNEIWYSKAQYNANPHTGSMDSWRNSLSPRQQLAVSKAFQNYTQLTDIGYDFSLKDMASADRMKGSFENLVISIISILPRGIKRISRKLKSGK